MLLTSGEAAQCITEHRRGVLTVLMWWYPSWEWAPGQGQAGNIWEHGGVTQSYVWLPPDYWDVDNPQTQGSKWRHVRTHCSALNSNLRRQNWTRSGGRFFMNFIVEKLSWAEWSDCLQFKMINLRLWWNHWHANVPAHSFPILRTLRASSIFIFWTWW